MPKKPKIFCSYTKLEDIDKVKPNPANPNKHSDTQVEILAKLITNHGWRHPITVSKRSGMVVSGHCRLMAAKFLGLGQIPIDEQDFVSEAEELAVLVADNQIPELSEINGLMMADILCELDQQNYPLDLTALTQAEIDDYIVGPTIPSEQDWIDSLENADGDKERTHFKITFVLPNEYRGMLEKIIKEEGKNEFIIRCIDGVPLAAN